MLSFTEFFTKKKIDINALQKAKPDLYQEFDRDYALMGEKSFDHSKKFWFNRLRKDYLLQEIEISESKKVEIKTEATASATGIPSSTAPAAAKPAGFRPKFKAAVKSAEDKQVESTAEAEDKPTTKAPTGFKPRFKAATPSENLGDPTGDIAGDKPADALKESEGAVAKPKGFTPRFKAANLPKQVESEKQEDIQAEASSENTEENKEAATSAKPKGFSPRFKAANLPKKVESEDKVESAPEAKEEASIDAPKPKGFTPRFKAANLPKKVEEPKQEDSEPVASTENAEEKKETAATAKPKGFTPRFKAANLPKKLEEKEEFHSDALPDNKLQEESSASDATEANPAEDITSKPTGFKPRFKAGVTKATTNQENKDPHPEQSSAPTEEPSTQTTTKPIGFKPRFMAKKSADQKDKED